jgi:hypothetical protein
MGEAQSVKMMIRLPGDVKEWLQRQAAHNLSPQNTEIVRALREKMQAEQRAAP